MVGKELENLQKFMDKFPVDKLPNIELKDYFDFCHFITYEEPFFGHIKGFQSYFFGIFPAKDGKYTKKENIKKDGSFAWNSHLGSTKEEAFKNVLSYILTIVNNAQSIAKLINQDNNYENYDELQQFLNEIEKVPELSDCFKWKIAFLYSDRKLVDWYSDKKLKKFVKYFDKKSKLKKISDLQLELMKIRDSQFTSPEDFYKKLWEIHTNKNSINNEDKTMTDTKKSDLAQKCAELLKNTKNIILHGAPGTGKTYLAREIAKAMGCTDNEIGFVQFHPSYDYTDFVEGLRPVNDDGSNGQIGFERRDGVFKEFCEKALQNYLDSQKTTEEIGKEKSVAEQINSFVSDAIEQNTEFEIVTGNKFKITDSNEKSIYISIPANEKVKDLVLRRSELSALLSSEKTFENGNDIRDFFSRKWRTQQDSYIIILYKKIKKELPIKSKKSNESKIALKNFVFIIDEINRGELSKIFGELFFAIDPGYRGKNGKIRTQYANMQDEQNKFDEALGINDRDNFGHFFVPDNVYIIGTMNDIDRSVESMDFAMRRRFTFKEITAEKSAEAILTPENLEGGTETDIKSLKNRMKNLNDAINEIGLSSGYQIGAAYFLKYVNYLEEEKTFEALWNYNLEPLLREYLRGQGDVENKLKQLKKAYENESEQEKNEQNAEASK